MVLFRIVRPIVVWEPRKERRPRWPRSLVVTPGTTDLVPPPPMPPAGDTTAMAGEAPRQAAGLTSTSLGGKQRGRSNCFMENSPLALGGSPTVGSKWGGDASRNLAGALGQMQMSGYQLCALEEKGACVFIQADLPAGPVPQHRPVRQGARPQPDTGGRGGTERVWRWPQFTQLERAEVRGPMGFVGA